MLIVSQGMNLQQNPKKIIEVEPNLIQKKGEIYKVTICSITCWRISFLAILPEAMRGNCLYWK